MAQEISLSLVAAEDGERARAAFPRKNFALFLLRNFPGATVGARRCDNRSSLIVRERVHRFSGKPATIGRTRIERCHRATRPAEDRFELRDGRASIGGARRRDLAHAMCGT